MIENLPDYYHSMGPDSVLEQIRESALNAHKYVREKQGRKPQGRPKKEGDESA